MKYKLSAVERTSRVEPYDDPEVAARTQEETALRVAGTGGGLEHRSHERPASDSRRPAVAGTCPDPFAVQHPAHLARGGQAVAHSGDCRPDHYCCSWNYRLDRPAGASWFRQSLSLPERSPGHSCSANLPSE